MTQKNYYSGHEIMGLDRVAYRALVNHGPTSNRFAKNQDVTLTISDGMLDNQQEWLVWLRASGGTVNKNGAATIVLNEQSAERVVEELADYFEWEVEIDK